MSKQANTVELMSKTNDEINWGVHCWNCGSIT